MRCIGLHIAGEIPHLPIFVDSPLAINVTEVFRLHPSDYDAETRDFMQRVRDPFGFAGLRYTCARSKRARRSTTAMSP